MSILSSSPPAGMPADTKRGKVKEVDLYSAFIVVPHTQGAQVRITQCYLQKLLQEWHIEVKQINRDPKILWQILLLSQLSQLTRTLHWHQSILVIYDGGLVNQCNSTVTLNRQPYEGRLPLTSWWRKSSNMTVGQSSLIYLAHHCYDWHPGSRFG